MDHFFVIIAIEEMNLLSWLLFSRQQISFFFLKMTRRSCIIFQLSDICWSLIRSWSLKAQTWLSSKKFFDLWEFWDTFPPGDACSVWGVQEASNRQPSQQFLLILVSPKMMSELWELLESSCNVTNFEGQSSTSLLPWSSWQDPESSTTGQCVLWFLDSIPQWLCGRWWKNYFLYLVWFLKWHLKRSYQLISEGKHFFVSIVKRKRRISSDNFTFRPQQAFSFTWECIKWKILPCSGGWLMKYIAF